MAPEPHEIVRCFTADFRAADEFDRKTPELWDVLSFFGGDEAQVDPKAEHNQRVRVVDGRAQRCGSEHPSEPAKTTGTELREAGSATAATGSGGDDGAAGAGTTQASHEGVEATLLGYFVVPFMRAHRGQHHRMGAAAPSRRRR